MFSSILSLSRWWCKNWVNNEWLLWLNQGKISLPVSHSLLCIISIIFVVAFFLHSIILVSYFIIFYCKHNFSSDSLIPFVLGWSISIMWHKICALPYSSLTHININKMSKNNLLHNFPFQKVKIFLLFSHFFLYS